MRCKIMGERRIGPRERYIRAMERPCSPHRHGRGVLISIAGADRCLAVFLSPSGHAIATLRP